LVSESGQTLILAGHRLRLSGTATGEIAAACAWMCPPARIDAHETAEWTVIADWCSPPCSLPAQPRQWTLRLGERAWPRLAVADTGPGWAVVAGQYRRGEELVRIEADRQARTTRVLIPAALAGSVRWVGWLVRVFFGTRMLAGGWLLLHAASVGMGGRAVLIGGAAGAGKSSLAHLACAQSGAVFMADDLTFIGRTPQAVGALGWPTRVCLPVDLMEPGEGTDHELHDMSSAWRRERWVLSPSQYSAATRFRRGGTAPVAATVLLERDGAGRRLESLAADPDHTAFMRDTLGLFGVPAAGQNGTDGQALGQLLQGVPLLHVDAGHDAADIAPDLWNQLRGVIRTEVTA
jgi:hypothetical protein